MNAAQDIVLFDKDSHRYSVNNEDYVSVTKVLSHDSKMYDSVNRFLLDRKKRIGDEFHCASHQIDVNNEASVVSDRTSLLLCSYISFLRDFDVDVVESERIVFSKKHRYAGTLDRVCVMKALSSKKVVLELKTTAARSKSHELQVAAYEYARREMLLEERSLDRYILYLYENKYVLTEKMCSSIEFELFLEKLKKYRKESEK